MISNIKLLIINPLNLRKKIMSPILPFNSNLYNYIYIRLYFFFLCHNFKLYYNYLDTSNLYFFFLVSLLYFIRSSYLRKKIFNFILYLIDDLIWTCLIFFFKDSPIYDFRISKLEISTCGKNNQIAT